MKKKRVSCSDKWLDTIEIHFSIWNLFPFHCLQLNFTVTWAVEFKRGRESAQDIPQTSKNMEPHLLSLKKFTIWFLNTVGMWNMHVGYVWLKKFQLKSLCIHTAVEEHTRTTFSQQYPARFTQIKSDFF